MEIKKSVMIVTIIISIIILFFWLRELTKPKNCPNCKQPLKDKIPNGYYCNHCRKLWIMNSFGKLKEWH